MSSDLTLGWDLGGAHVKAVLLDEQGVALRAMQVACPLWRGMEYLHSALDQVMAEVAMPVGQHAVTMTGELADIFASRDEGVARLSGAMFERAGQRVRIYAGAQGFVGRDEVELQLAGIASANWHASAAFLATQAGDALLLDIGSTTSDLVVLHHDKPEVLGWTDAGRMQRDELIYTGATRTPVMAVSRRVPFAGEWQALAAEHFATMADVYRLTGDLSDELDMAETADGAGKSREESARRLARMLGRDLADAASTEWRRLAVVIKSQQIRMLQDAMERQLSRGLLADDAPLLGAGAGRFLVRELARLSGRGYRDAADWVRAVPAVGDWAVVCLPAYAVGHLAQEAVAWA